MEFGVLKQSPRIATITSRVPLMVKQSNEVDYFSQGIFTHLMPLL